MPQEKTEPIVFKHTESTRNQRPPKAQTQQSVRFNVESEHWFDENRPENIAWARANYFVGELSKDGEFLTISSRKLLQEVKTKTERSTRASAGMRFFFFIAIYAAVVVLQKDASRVESVSNALYDYLVGGQSPSFKSTYGDTWADFDAPGNASTGCYDTECETPSYVLKGYLDIMSVGDFWEWFSGNFVGGFYIPPAPGNQVDGTASNTYVFQVRAMNSFRWLQRRALPGSYLPGASTGDCWSSLQDSPIARFAVGCFDRLDGCSASLCANEDTTPFGTFANRTKYRYESVQTGPTARMDTPDGGYWVRFPYEDPGGLAAAAAAAALQEDLWLDRAAQRLRIDTFFINGNTGKLVSLTFNLRMEVTGLVLPTIDINVVPINWYNFNNASDVIRLLLELVIVGMWIHYVTYLMLDRYRFGKSQTDSDKWYRVWRDFLNSSELDSVRPHSYVWALQLSLLGTLIMLWVVIVGRPMAPLLVPTPDGIFESVTGPGGPPGPLFIDRATAYLSLYWFLNGTICLLFVVRILGIAKANPQFSLLSDALDLMKWRLLDFLVAMLMMMIAFALQAIFMFGSIFAGLSDFELALGQLFSLMFGAGGGVAAKYRGGGRALIINLDYAELKLVAPNSGWIFFYPFTFTMKFVVMNIIIAIITEAYNKVKDQHNPRSPNFAGAPSDALRQPNFAKQVARGIARRAKLRAQKLLKKKAAKELTKPQLLTILTLLPPDFDWDCSTPDEFLAAARAAVAAARADGSAAVPALREAAADPALERITSGMVSHMVSHYDVIVNTLDDVMAVEDARAPMAGTVWQKVEAVNEQVEAILSGQARLHAHLDEILKLYIC